MSARIGAAAQNARAGGREPLRCEIMELGLIQMPRFSPFVSSNEAYKSWLNGTHEDIGFNVYNQQGLRGIKRRHVMRSPLASGFAKLFTTREAAERFAGTGPQAGCVQG
jgi:hypothetical protein